MALSKIQNAAIDSLAASKLTGQVPDANAPSGSVIQVVQTVKTDGFVTSSGSYVDITGLSVTITPSSTSSKILVVSNFFAGSPTYPYPKFQLLRNGANIFQGDSLGSATRQSAAMNPSAASDVNLVAVSTQYLDSPATTSAVTYKWQTFTYGGRNSYVGRTEYTGDLNGASVPSTIMVMEIAA
jgi:hypothetical protein